MSGFPNELQEITQPPPSATNSITPPSGVLTVNGGLTTNGIINLGAHTAATISSGSLAFVDSVMLVGAEGAAATDDCDTISGGKDGDLVYLSGASSAQDITFKHATGNLRLQGGLDFAPLTADYVLLLKYRNGKWQEVSRSYNA